MTIICKDCQQSAKVSKWDTSGICKPCAKTRNEKRLAESRVIVQSGHCPQCGSTLRRNLALTGWYQCAQFGADGFRADSTKPACSFQIFV